MFFNEHTKFYISNSQLLDGIYYAFKTFFFYLILMKILLCKYYAAHFTDKEMEALRGEYLVRGHHSTEGNRIQTEFFLTSNLMFLWNNTLHF